MSFTTKQKDHGLLLEHNVRNAQNRETHQVDMHGYSFPNASVQRWAVDTCFPYNQRYLKNIFLLVVLPQSPRQFAIFKLFCYLLYL